MIELGIVVALLTLLSVTGLVKMALAAAEEGEYWFTAAFLVMAICVLLCVSALYRINTGA